jgi:hypothetical protein
MSDQARPFLRIFTDTGSPVRAQHVSQTESQEVDSSPGPQEVRPDSETTKMRKWFAGESGVPVRSGVSVKVPDSETLSRVPDIGPRTDSGKSRREGSMWRSGITKIADVIQACRLGA